MNKITHEGNDYEVLTRDRISEITHARLAGGVIVNSEYDPGFHRVTLLGEHLGTCFKKPFIMMELEMYGIQPLKLLEKVPVEFTDTFAQCVDGKWYPVYSLDDGFGYQRCEQKVFRCVEVTK